MKEYSVVGKPLPRVDGKWKATGAAKYTVDMVLPRMLHAKILRSPHAHAKIVNIDTSKAGKLPGVKAVITGKDTAGVRYAFVDTPRYPADEMPLAEDKVRYIGEPVAAVAAVDELTAEQALSLIEVEYEPLPAVFDPEEAMKDGAPKIHDEIVRTTTTAWEDWGVGRKARPLKIENNIAATFQTGCGDVEEGFAQSDYIREDRYTIPATSHAAIEPHGILASFDPLAKKLDVWVGHMGYEVKRYWLAKTLELPISSVRLHKVYVGGAFGGKVIFFPHDFLAGFLSMKLGRPVKIVLSRAEVFAATNTSHRMIIDVKTGVKRDGTIMARHVKIINDPGAYRGSGPVVNFLTYALSTPILNVPNIKFEGVSVYTNKSMCYAKRGHGGPQISFVIDSQLDMIAEDLGLDPIAIRLKNMRSAGDVLPNGDVLRTYALPECIEKATETIGWKEKWGKQDSRGVGIGLAAYGCGLPYWPFASAAIVRLNHDGTATLYCGAVEFGQGSDTAMSQIAAEELGLSLDDIILISNDSELCPLDFSNWLSSGVYVDGEAVRRAAADAKQQLLEDAAQALEIKSEDLEVKGGRVYVREDPSKVMSFAELVRDSIQRQGGNPIIGRGYVKALPEVEFYPSLSKGTGHWAGAYKFTAITAEVEVDRDTGKVKLVQVVVADDSGFDINPLNVEGQLDSQAVMGQGDVMFEEIIMEEGSTINCTFGDYKLPGAVDAPKLKAISITAPDPRGPYGAKEVGEGARPAVLPAIANAVYDAVGVRINDLPITAEKVFKALKEKSAKP